jgi:hypothetical protein
MHGSADVGIGGGDVDATVQVEGGANQVRNSASDACESAADSQIAHTDASRNQKVEQGGHDEKTDTRTTTEVISTQNNPNPKRTLMIRYFQEVEEYTSFLCLTKVEVAYRTTDAKVASDRQVSLPHLDRLLNDVVVPSQAAHVRDRIKRMLQIILDYQDQPTNIVEEVPLGPDRTMLRLKRNLQSTYQLKDENGNFVRNITVDGLLLRVFQRRIRGRNTVSDLTVGEHDAV